MILGEAPEEEEMEGEEFREVYQQAVDLYGSAHSRFILTQKGMQIMKTKYLAGHFGKCARIECQNSPVLPVGLYDELNMSRVKVFCPKCEDIFVPRGRRASVSSLSGSQIDLDGSYFGPSFPHILLQNHPELAPKQAIEEYIPKIWGFKVAGKPGSKVKKLPELDKEEDKKETEPEFVNSGEEKKA